jgi:hypothetical protein
MNKRVFFILIFVPFILNFAMSQLRGDAGLSLHKKLQFNHDGTRISLIKRIKKGKRLFLRFSFPEAVKYEISFNEHNQTAQIIFHQVARDGFMEQMQIDDEFFSEIHLSYSHTRSYRIRFQLRDDVRILPFGSRGQAKEPGLGFILNEHKSKKSNNLLQLKDRISKELASITAPAITHLSNRYKPQERRKNIFRQLPLIVRTDNMAEKIVEPGVSRFQFSIENPRSEGYGFRIHRSVSKERLTATLAGGALPGCRPLSDIVRENNAVIGINGSFYIPDGSPIGLFIHEHQLLSVPVLLRSSFGIDREGKAHIGHPEFQGEAITRKGKIEISAINQNSSSPETTLFTPKWSLPVRAQEGRIYISILMNRITAISEKPPKPNITRSPTYILSISKKLYPLVKELEIDSPVFLSFGLSSPWQNMRFALSGGPRLLKNSQPADISTEGFSKDFLTARAPRSAIGLDEKGNIILVVIDGRQSHSIGLTLSELSQCMAELGATEAMNLDGGGSSTLFHAGEIINSPSEGRQRPIANALVLLSR